MADLPSIFALCGDEPFLIRRRALDFQAAHEKQGAVSRQQCDLNKVGWSFIQDQANTFSLMGEKPFIEVRVVKEVSVRDEAGILAYLADPSPRAAVLLIFSKLDKRKKLYKALKSAKILEECQAPKKGEVGKWLRTFEQELAVTLDPGAKAILVDFLGPQLAQLYQAIERLKLYCYPEANISASDVEAVILRSSGDSVFELIDAIFSKKLDQALLALQFAERNGDPTLILLSLILRHLKILIKAHEARSNRLSASQWAAHLGVPPFVVKTYQQQLSHISMDQAQALIFSLGELDKTFKSSAIPHYALFQRWLSGFCRQKVA